MKLVLAIVKPFKVTEIVDAVANDPLFPGLTTFEVRGFGSKRTTLHEHTREEDLRDFTPHSAVMVACPDERSADVVATIREVAHTGLAGDGKVFVLDLEEVWRMAADDQGEDALS